MILIHPIYSTTKSSLKSINFYIIETDRDLLLLDAGYPTETCWDDLQSELHRLGYEVTDLSAILLTHHHPDHVGLVNTIRGKVEIPLYVHEKSTPRLRREPNFMDMRIAFYEQLYRESGCGDVGKEQIQHLLASLDANASQAIDGELTYVDVEQSLFGFEVLEVPGHSPDQIAFQYRDLLISGDLLIGHISSNAIVEPNEDGERIQALSQHVQSLQKIANTNVNTVHPGHGSVITDPKALIHERLEGVKRKTDAIRDLLYTSQQTASDVAKQMYEKRYKSQFPLVMSEIIGHLDYMEQLHMVDKEYKHGVYMYSAR